MSNVHVLLIGNDTILEIERLRDELSGAYLNEASASVTLVDADGAEVAGDTWPKPVEHVTGSEGLYRVTLPYTLVLTQDARYTARLVVDGGPGLVAAWSVECVARLRN